MLSVNYVRGIRRNVVEDNFGELLLKIGKFKILPDNFIPEIWKAAISEYGKKKGCKTGPNTAFSICVAYTNGALLLPFSTYIFESKTWTSLSKEIKEEIEGRFLDKLILFEPYILRASGAELASSINNIKSSIMVYYLRNWQGGNPLSFLATQPCLGSPFHGMLLSLAQDAYLMAFAIVEQDEIQGERRDTGTRPSSRRL